MKSVSSRVYYGEYTLRHWVDLILCGDIELPNYQRSFVWNKKDVERLLFSLNDGLFVPPVTIGHYKTKKQNLILDGQQRLTSILLFALGVMPKKESFDAMENLASGDDSATGDSSADTIREETLGWTFRTLLNEGSRKTLLEWREVIKNNAKYDQLDVPQIENINEFLEQRYLGFSYIVPKVSDNREQQKYFSMLFRNINYWGVKLSSMESRRSLYFMNDSLTNFFEGKISNTQLIFNNIFIQENWQTCKIDFVRYLSILSQYYVLNGNVSQVLRGYAAYSTRENFYADYVSYIVGIEGTRADLFGGFKFEEVFPNNSWKDCFLKAKETIDVLQNEMDLESKNNILLFKSWIDADYWLFGLLYFILFEKKSIDMTNSNSLANRIKEEIQEKKRDGTSSYVKAPNRLGYLRERISHSIDIYKDYVS